MVVPVVQVSLKDRRLGLGYWDFLDYFLFGSVERNRVISLFIDPEFVSHGSV